MMCSLVLSLCCYEQKKKFGGVMKALKVITRVNKLCPCCRVRFYALEKVSGCWEVEKEVVGRR